MRVSHRFLSMLTVLVVVLSLLAVTALADTAAITLIYGDGTRPIDAATTTDAQPVSNVPSNVSSVSISYTALATSTEPPTLSGGGLTAPVVGDDSGVNASDVPLDYGENDFVLTVTVDSTASPTEPATVTSYYFRVVRALLPAVDAAFTFNANVTEGAPEAGSAENPYLITSVDDLRQLSANVNGGTSYDGKFFVLRENLEEVGPWIPIGTEAHPFSGSFDFSGLPVSGYEIDQEIIKDYSLTDVGLFGYLRGAEIKSTGAAATVSGSIEYASAENDATQRYIGLLAGRAVNSSISDLSTGGSISVNAGAGGAFSVGRLTGTLDVTSSADACGSTASLSFANTAANPAVSNIGGLAGENAGEISNCSFSVDGGKIDASNALGKVYFGGVAGDNTGNISDSTVTLAGEMKGSHYHSGGIAGTNSGSIADCALSGSGAFTAVPHSFGSGDEGSWGGIAGTNLTGGVISDCDNSSTALTSFSTPGAGVNIGGIAGVNAGTVGKCSSTAKLAAANAPSVYMGGIVGGSSGSISNCRFSGSVNGGLSEPLERQSALGGIVGYSEGSMSGCTSSGSVTVSAQHSGADPASVFVGGISGAYQGSVMEDCSNSGNVTARAYLQGEDDSDLKLYTGGITGYNKSTIRNSGSSGDVTSSIEELSGNVKAKSTSFCGGAAGLNSGKIQNVYSTGKVASTALNPASTAYAGGVTGSNSGSGSLANVYATGDISAAALTKPTLASVEYETHVSRPVITVGCVTGVKEKTSTVSMAYYAVEMAPSEEVLSVGGKTSDSGTGCIQFSSEYMASDEFADAMHTNAGYLNYKNNRSDTLHGWDLPVSSTVNSGYPVFSYQTAPLNNSPFKVASNTEEAEETEGAPKATEESLKPLEPLPYSEPQVVTVDDKNANPSTGISGVDPALGLVSLAAVLIPSAALLWLCRRKK